jgi:hypothetical protein
MSEEKFSLDQADRDVFRSAFEDGLVDIFMPSWVLMFVVGPYLSVYLGDFWSSAIFLPFWAIVIMVLFWIRKNLIRPRAGLVKYGVVRRKKLSAFTWIMLSLNVLFLLLSIFAFLNLGASGWIPAISFALMLLVFSSLAGYFLEVTRFYVYGLMMASGLFIGELLYQNFGFSHHGYPVVFGFSAGVIFLTGVYKLITFIQHNPLPSEEQVEWEANNG